MRLPTEVVIAQIICKYSLNTLAIWENIYEQFIGYNDHT